MTPPPQLDLHTIDVVTIDLIKWIKKARPDYQFGTDKEWDSLIERVTGYRTEEGMNDILSSMEKRSSRDMVLNNIIELVDARIEGLDDLMATPPEQRTESAQDKYLKEARFELGLVQDEYKGLRQAGEPE
jgi:hypothetical protein